MTEEPLYRQKEWLEQKYWIECLHFNKIAELAGCSPSCISTWFAKLGIERKKKRTVPIYMTEEEALTHKAEGQQFGSISENYPFLYILFDDIDATVAFLKEYMEKKPSRIRNTVVLIDQMGDKIHLTYHYKKISKMGPEVEHGPSIRTFSISKIDYREYINSEEWRQKADALKKKVGKCQVCSSHYNLRAHHNSYENLGHEHPEDLVILCDTCHSIFHSYGGRIKPDNYFTFEEK